MKKEPLVSIIIANWNGGKVLANCLDSLSKIDYKNTELIIVDNASTDGSSRNAIIKNKTNVGFARANNQGYQKARGKYVLLLNNDTIVTKDFLGILVNVLENDESIGVAQPKIYMLDKPGYLDNAGSFFTRIGFLEHWGFGKKDSNKFSKQKEVFSTKGACMLIRNEVIEKVGLFDDDFVSYFEESDFCWRVWLAGWRILFYPKAKIFHKVGFTIKRLDVGNINYHYYKNRISSLIKNLSIVNLLFILPIHLALSLAIACAFMVKGQPKSAGIILQAISWNIKNMGKTIAKRKKVQKLRKVTDKKLFTKLLRPVNLIKFIGDFNRVAGDLKTRET